jgi:hypothetical protein
MKKIVVLAVAILGLFVVQPVQATETSTIAIIDTAIDSSKNTNVVYEVCFTLKTCPNGTSFQEGKGSAMVSDWKVKGVEHGFNVSQAAVLANPSVKIVFIRISDINVYSKFSAMHNDGRSLALAIDWVSKNSAKFNIKAVSISQSRSNFAAGTCPKDSVFESAVSNLNLQNVATFVATGNDSKKNMIGFPSCVPGVIAVGALRPTSGTKPFPASSYTDFATYTNVGPGLDVVAKGDADIKSLGGWNITITGTSVATPIAASLAVARNSSLTWDAFIAGLPKSANYPYISN